MTKNYDTSNVRFVNDIDTSNKMGINPLINAARLGNAKIVEKLINGADVNATNKMGFTAIAKAAQIGHLELFESLLMLAQNLIYLINMGQQLLQSHQHMDIPK